jgi:hypothetical protein
MQGIYDSPTIERGKDRGHLSRKTTNHWYFRLGVHGPGSDIDTICVCPRHVFKEHFFGEFKEMLRDWPAVTEISVSYIPPHSCGLLIVWLLCVGRRVCFCTSDENCHIRCRS